MDRKIPIRKFGDEARLPRQRSIRQHQAPWQSLLAISEPKLQLSSRGLRIDKMSIGGAIYRDRVDFSPLRLTGQKRFVRCVGQEVSKWKVDMEPAHHLLHHARNRLRHIHSCVLILADIKHGGSFPVVKYLPASVIPGHAHPKAVWPARKDINRVENVQWLAIRIGGDADRPYLNRKFFRQQGLAHLQKS